jgi:hypothetical protein
MRDPEIERQATLDALDRMREDGADLSKSLDIDFHVAVPSREAGQVVASEAEVHGFRTRIVQDDRDASWTVWCTRALVPTEPTIARFEVLLDGIAQPHGGYIDGWGSWSGSW